MNFPNMIMRVLEPFLPLLQPITGAQLLLLDLLFGTVPVLTQISKSGVGGRLQSCIL